MKILGALLVLIQHLPEILELLNRIDERVKEAKTERKVSEDIKAIGEAFKNKDATKLNEIFNS